MQYWPIFEADGEHQFVGVVGLHWKDKVTCELGFHLRPQFWRRGLAVEAATAVLDHAFETLKLVSVVAGHAPANEASRRTIQRLGFSYTHDGEFEGEADVLYELRAASWMVARAANEHRRAASHEAIRQPAATEHCRPCDDATSSALPPPALPLQRGKRRSVDYLLEGESIRTNRHLARFAAAPYLQTLLHVPAFSPMFSRSSKGLRKELIEAYAALEQLELILDAPASQRANDGSQHQPPPTQVLVDLCCGKGFFSLIAALERPSMAVVMIDSSSAIKTEHADALPNLTFLRADIMSSAFAATLDTALTAACTPLPPQAPDRVAVPGCGIAVGIHLCGKLSPRAVELFCASPLLSTLLLVPCCLHKIADAELKLRAKALAIEPYEAKVEELVGLLEGACDGVRVVRDGEMRTQGGGAASEGSVGAKNALILGTKRIHHGVVTRSS